MKHKAHMEAIRGRLIAVYTNDGNNYIGRLVGVYQDCLVLDSNPPNPQAHRYLNYIPFNGVCNVSVKHDKLSVLD